MKALHRRRGVALLVVISALALIMILFVAVATSVQNADVQYHVTAQNQSRSQQTAAILSRFGSDASVAPQMEVKAGISASENPVDVERQALTASDSCYGAATGLKYRSGDVLMTLIRKDIKQSNAYLVNVEGRRPGVVYLGKP